jgi:hypothetical protein
MRGWSTWIAVAPAFIFVYAMNYWAWHAPARALRGRGQYGEARTADDARRRLAATQTYWQLILGGLIMAFAILKLSAGKDIMSGWNRLWLVAWALVIGVVTYALFRKWRYGSPDQNHPGS